MTTLVSPSRHKSSSWPTSNLLSPRAAPVLSSPSPGIPALCSRQTTEVRCGSFSFTLSLGSFTEFGSFYLSSETISLHLHGHPHVSSLALCFQSGLWPVPLHMPSREVSTKYSLISIISCLKPFRLFIALGFLAQAVSTGGKALPDLIWPCFLLRPYHFHGTPRMLGVRPRKHLSVTLMPLYTGFPGGMAWGSPLLRLSTWHGFLLFVLPNSARLPFL